MYNRNSIPTDRMRENALKTIRANREKKKKRFEKLYQTGLLSIAEVSQVCGVSLRTGKYFWKEIKSETGGDNESD